MLGACTLLYRVTGDTDALSQAEAIAVAALEHFDGGALDGQPAPFNAIFFRNLLLLAPETHNPAYPAAPRAYAERVWSAERDPATNLATRSAPLAPLDQAALVEVNALLA